MNRYTVILILLCLGLLLSLAACVETRAEPKAGSAAPETTEAPASEQPELPDIHKTPIEEIGGKEQPQEKPKQDKGFSDELIIGFGKDYDPGLIPVPEPIEPPVEEQSEESSVAEE
ncbi:MAG: hypothetical protein IJA48_05200 [Oscillospiraceae bacterium]|nr:hypothetical protein [Oscillospiraceae bacterium]